MKMAITATAIALLALLAEMSTGEDDGDMNGYNVLTEEETRVIVDRMTEAPFIGEYVDFWEDGTYHCRRCGALLYDSHTKFDSGCGWPAFDAEVEGAVERRPDPDGHRTEIVCANCGAHLGHVFEGEGFTPTDTRHCVNSISLLFEARAEIETAIFAGGCFWGIEEALESVEGVVDATSGYTGGTTESPTYQEVCTGTTGHAEAVEVVFDPRVVSYEELARLFFEIHDPTTPDRQGPDIGSQYRSAIFYTSKQQRETAERLIG
ncbi:bifunctional methionine sulfoxide reductase B/A protein, partial [Candidatus Fermentibacterales bacterium]|nr:bifunctional methionine sulfoxide reductase B/A protein [Candidatus Fermentibacterales bacterium]